MSDIGKCEFCGCESNQRSEENVICTRCTDIITTELWRLKDDEPAKNAYRRAAQICKLRGKIAKLREENDALRDEIAAYKNTSDRVTKLEP